MVVMVVMVVMFLVFMIEVHLLKVSALCVIYLLNVGESENYFKITAYLFRESITYSPPS